MNTLRRMAHAPFTSGSSTRLINPASLRRMTGPADALAGSDPEQVRLMSEQVIRVDHNDTVIGSMSKKDSHLISNNLPLHRAFSVFLFDTQGRMLLQQRAAAKVTFPSYWTNTVCSHPLYTPAERGLEDDGDPVMGTKRAALRKLNHELGIALGTIHVDDLHYMTRIHYRADCKGGLWGEHEIDYVFFAQKEVELFPESNEVSAVRYVTGEELKAMFGEAARSDRLRLTPWFQYIVNGFAWPWWDKLLAEGVKSLPDLQDSSTVHAMGKCGEPCSL